MDKPSSNGVGHSAWKQDSTSLVLHTRRTVFVLLIVSLLVVVGIVFGDSYRLRNAIEELKIVNGLAALWHEDIGKIDSRSLLTTLVGKVPELQNVPKAYELTVLSRETSGESIQPRCIIDLDLDQRLFVLNDEEVLYIQIDREKKIVTSHFTDPYTRRTQKWKLDNAPETLVNFAKLWNILQSNSESAHFFRDALANGMAKGVLVQDNEIYEVEKIRRLHLQRLARPAENNDCARRLLLGI